MAGVYQTFPYLTSYSQTSKNRLTALFCYYKCGKNEQRGPVLTEKLFFLNQISEYTYRQAG